MRRILNRVRRQVVLAVKWQVPKIEIDDEAFDRVYGFLSHPVSHIKGRNLAVRVINQFGDESTKVLML